MKNLSLLLLILISVTAFSQKPKKTHKHDKFVNKVKLSFSPDFIVKWMPDDQALKYIAEKSGRSFDELKEENDANTKNVQANIQYFLDNNIAFVINKTEVKTVQESPVKIADILMHCSFKDNTFTIKLSNCVQTNISWYLGNEVVPEGDGFDNFIAYNEEKKEKKSKLLENLEELEEKQNKIEEENEKQRAFIDSLNELRPGYEAKIFAMQGIERISKYYNMKNVDLPLEGYYILNNNQVVDAVIAYRAPEFMVGDVSAAISLMICHKADGEKNGCS
jgi:hypothetical protein